MTPIMRFWPVDEAKRALPSVTQDIVGPVCETGDYLALERALPPFAAGDLMAVMTAGAYGAAMSSTYNSRLLVPEVLVNGADLRRRSAAPNLRRPDRPRRVAGLVGVAA